jgi:hypothetical protein
VFGGSVDCFMQSFVVCYLCHSWSDTVCVEYTYYILYILYYICIYRVYFLVLLSLKRKKFEH